MPLELKKLVVVGDIHGRWSHFHPHYLKMREEVGHVDALISLGDTGFWPRIYSPPGFSFDHPVFWLDGNHEDHETLVHYKEPHLGFHDPYHRPLETKGWVQFAKEWTYMPRGTILGGCLFIGGAKSVNAHALIRGLNWFPEENLSYKDMEHIRQAVDDYGPERIHTVFSHDCPSAFDVREACVLTGGKVFDDSNRRFMQEILQDVCPEKWFFGHYHKPMSGTWSPTGTSWRCVDMTREPSKPFDYVVLELPFDTEDWSNACNN